MTPAAARVTVVGLGTSGAELPAEAQHALAGAQLVIGAARHLAAAEAAGAIPDSAHRITLGPLAPALNALTGLLTPTTPNTPPAPTTPKTPETPTVPNPSVTPATPAPSVPPCAPSAPSAPAAPAAPRAVVLASGDPGFFGIVRALAERLGPEELNVIPSPSSVAMAFARLGIPWDDAVVVSAHGRELRTAANLCRAHRKVAVLTAPGAGPAELGAALLATPGVERRLIVAADLGGPAERLDYCTPAEAAERSWPAVNLVLCLGTEAATRPAPAMRTIAALPAAPDTWALPESAFAHRDSMVTKAEVRALALARLGPRPGDLVWDVGAGSGSVAVECARLGAAAVAVERAADGIDRIRANAAAHGVDVSAVHGEAPEALAALPSPDSVFIGGGGSGVAALAAYCADRARRTVVVTLAALDRVPAVRAALAGAGLDVDGVLLQSSRLAPLPGEVTRLAATNPVFVLWGSRPSARYRQQGATPS
ncbi:bifunctional cobalt-precorrin-7 (C(5))-methyltransferase/cobalt-precorrin-6B (C(15))-methyltransferase [Phaeacidiphilus oryzae]|uniref:bifunctional cobalt-precorrin-7 (C(5))-methyltransferase/cobalt-precorrin-6B (C(15))-methyltransferase n=1 Tax=Phaeacidiphilus oryzae TaxID=348818 RepID=UPI00055BD32B|nr:bifunctional cobalt-precorrin-7 (C(5))-methyltransferase/cobalt-precorrin-6B (C(15))-methyltransferase [Phaeacidiphilus oryzae]